MKIAVAGAGAFGTALAISLARTGKDITLVARNEEAALQIKRDGVSPRLPNAPIPENLKVSGSVSKVADADAVLLAIPTQKLGTFLDANSEALSDKFLIACCKGIDLKTLAGPTTVISTTIPNARAGILTGPSFADDIAIGRPTALTLAISDAEHGELLQHALTTEDLRIYRTTDVIGAEMGGALKNVIAIGAGGAIGAGLGDSARAAMMTRGFGEMQVLATTLGADPKTLNGLAGFGDLVLTCTSSLSRNFSYGLALGAGETPDPSKTVEGVTTARAVVDLARTHDLDLPVSKVIAVVCNGDITIQDALAHLIARPLREE